MTPHVRSAKIVETLVDYDGPQLLALKSDHARHMLAIAVRKRGMDEPFFGAEIPDKAFELYFDETADLYYALRRAVGDKYYFFDLSLARGDTVVLLPAKPEEVSDPALWPGVGIFARSHTTSYLRQKITGTIRKFVIDGKWRTNDFSLFHAKMADLYGLFGVLDRLQSAHGATEKAFIETTIRDRFWRGGGSYVGFYDSLIERNKLLKLEPLEVAKIQYASPGEIELRGNKRALADVADIIALFDESGPALAASYRAIHGTLRVQKLLRAVPSARFSNKQMELFVREKTDAFAKDMRLDHTPELFEACRSNVLVFAKVIMSVYRRANELYIFHAEGRVQKADQAPPSITVKRP